MENENNNASPKPQSFQEFLAALKKYDGSKLPAAKAYATRKRNQKAQKEVKSKIEKA